ncbi:head-tail adaptor protein [Methylobacterium phyllosphaerae]
MAPPSQHPPLGARRRRFVLERPLEEPDGFGGVLRRYVAGPVLWGAMVPAGLVDRPAGGRCDTLGAYRVTLRGRADLDPTMRLAAGPRRFAIRAVTEPDARDRDRICQVEELPREGRS